MTDNIKKENVNQLSSSKPGLIVAGPGAMGSVLGAFLTESFNVFFLGRRGAIQHSAKIDLGNGLRDFNFAKANDQELSRCSTIIFPTKAYDLQRALEDHLPRLADGTTFITLANGFVEPILKKTSEAFPSLKMRLGYCNFGVSTDSGNYFFRSKGTGRMFWGPIGTDQLSSSEMVLNKNHYCEWCEDIVISARSKWLFNTVLNGITAAHALGTNGEVLARKPALKALFEEAWDLSFDLFGGIDAEKHEVWMGLLSLINDTSENENSMARDVRLGKRTESDYLAGLATAFGDKYPGLVHIHKRSTK